MDNAIIIFWLTRYRADTKEKPFLCRCGAAFTRRDLLTRHHRLSKHDGDGDNSTTANVVLSSTETDFDRAAAAESLSCLSGVSCQQWPTVNDHPHSVNDVFGHVDTRHVNDGAVRDAYHQSLLGPQMFTAGPFATFRCPVAVGSFC